MKKKSVSPSHLKYLRKLRRNNGLILFCQFALVLAFLGLWQLLADKGVIDSFITSSPSKVWTTFATLAKVDLWRHVGVTLMETVVGFLLSFVVGTLIAILLWFSETVRRIVEPYLIVLNALPKIALGPLIIVWIGAGREAIITMAVLISIIITIINTLTGFVSVPQEKLLLMKTLGANKWQTLWKLVFPASLPTVTACLKINVGMSWVGSIMGEYLVSKAGLGYLIVYGGQVFNLSLVMCSTVILSVLAGLMYLAVALVEKVVTKAMGL